MHGRTACMNASVWLFHHAFNACLNKIGSFFKLMAKQEHFKFTEISADSLWHCHTNPLFQWQCWTTQLDLNISHNIRSIGTLSSAPRKNRSSIILGLTDRSEGSISRSFPNLTCCSGFLPRQYSPSIPCAWSCSLSTMWGARRPRRSEKNCVGLH